MGGFVLSCVPTVSHMTLGRTVLPWLTLLFCLLTHPLSMTFHPCFTFNCGLKTLFSKIYIPYVSIRRELLEVDGFWNGACALKWDPGETVHNLKKLSTIILIRDLGSYEVGTVRNRPNVISATHCASLSLET